MKSHRVKAPLLLRWPLRRAVEPVSAARRWLDRAEWFAAPLALLVGVLPLPIGGRIVGVVLVALAFALAVVLRARPRRHPSGWIIVDPNGIARHRPSGDARLVFWAERFGVVVLSNESKTRGLIAITTPEQTRYVPVRVAGDDDATPARELFARGPSLSDMDVALAPLDGDEALSAGDALALVATVRAHDRAAIDRILLSDPHGAAVVLEGNELRAGDRVIDLTAPLEWRAFLFLESAGPLGAVVQATWVRQAGTEVVLVAPQSDTREPAPRGGRIPSIPDAPPPIELRMAIERLFMAPFRHALDRAPRASRSPTPAASSRRGEGRAPTS
ncbi:MAG: hypothetical protein ACLQVI_42260 [Polyangiaceae bacterium]